MHKISTHRSDMGLDQSTSHATTTATQVITGLAASIDLDLLLLAGQRHTLDDTKYVVHEWTWVELTEFQQPKETLTRPAGPASGDRNPADPPSDRWGSRAPPQMQNTNERAPRPEVPASGLADRLAPSATDTREALREKARAAEEALRKIKEEEARLEREEKEKEETRKRKAEDDERDRKKREEESRRFNDNRGDNRDARFGGRDTRDPRDPRPGYRPPPRVSNTR
jgi:hypothetical protein